MRLKTVRDIDVHGKRALVRVDFNVPLDQNGKVADDTRIRAALPTLRYLLDKGASMVIMSHLGRPKGVVVESMRMDGVAEKLQDMLGTKVLKLDKVAGDDVQEACKALEKGGIILLENLRFDPGEEENDPEFSASLARLGDIYVDDAFGAAHRSHASVEGVAAYLPAVAGLLMEKEIETLQGLIKEPSRPFVAVLGGSKISDKLKVLGRFQDLVDTILVGGGMCFTIMKSNGMEIGDSLCEDELLEEVSETMSISGKARASILLPDDVVVASEFKADAKSKVVDANEIPPGWMGLDIGPRSIEKYKQIIKGAKTVFWNGPMGVFEWKRFQEGTREIAQAIADSGAVTVAGGGDTLAAIEKFGLEGRFTHLSTGGGAAMELLEGKNLPGVEVLEKIDE
jgi:phosphoglycerate kinase